MEKYTHPEILNIYIGFDEAETVAFHTLAQSIISRSSGPIRISPICTDHYRKFYNRERDPKQSNSFSFTRFLVPYLNSYSGHAIFMDCDMLIRTDIFNIFDEVNMEDAVSVVQHDYTPSEKVKYLNNVQYQYPRKNWSSFILWNCAHAKNQILTPDFVERASGLELHRFTWLNDEEIGSLDINWNWLVGDYIDPTYDVKNVHWTNGGPYFKEYSQVDFHEEWLDMIGKVNYCLQKK